MSLTINPNNINIDTIRNLDIDKQYYLSKSGQIKEASGWMKFKCMIGCSGARQKVANLIDVVRATLLNSVDKTHDAALDTDIRTIKRDKMVSGEDLYHLATKFAEANPQTIAKNTAEKMIASDAKQWANVLMAKHNFVANDSAVLEKIIQHGLKRLFNNPLPMKKDSDSIMKLDRAVFDDRMKMALNTIDAEISAIINKTNLGNRPMDKHFAQHIIDTLFNKDGTRNDESVKSLKTPIQVKVEVAFKRNKISESLNDTFISSAYKELVKNNIDPEKKVEDILKLCGNDQELEMLVLEKIPELCVDSNIFLRSDEKIKEMVGNIKDALYEVRQVAKQFPGCAEALKLAIVSLGSAPMPKGLLTNIAKIVQDANLDKFTKLTSLSTADEIYKGIEQLRKLTANIENKLNVVNEFKKAGEEEVGGPHVNASNLAAIAMVISKAGPGLLARLPNIIKGTECQKVNSAINMLMADIGKGLPVLDVTGKNNNAQNILVDQGRLLGLVQSCVGVATGKDLPLMEDIAVNPQDKYVQNIIDTLKKA